MLEEVAAAKEERPSDYVFAFAKSQASRVLVADLSDRDNRMLPSYFVAWLRFFARLPQIPHLSGPSVECKGGYMAEMCMSGHNKGEKALLDLHGNHAHGKCPSSSKGMHKKHRLMNKVLQRFAKKTYLQEWNGSRKPTKCLAGG
jgi:hypothetical protein